MNEILKIDLLMGGISLIAIIFIVSAIKKIGKSENRSGIRIIFNSINEQEINPYLSNINTYEGVISIVTDFKIIDGISANIDVEPDNAIEVYNYINRTLPNTLIRSISLSIYTKK